MHSLVGQSILYDRVQRVMLGNSLELEVTGERAVIRVGGIERDTPADEVVFRQTGIVCAFRMVAQVIEEQGGPEELAAPNPRTCPMCEGRLGGFDDLENWIDCPKCGG